MKNALLFLLTAPLLTAEEPARVHAIVQGSGPAIVLVHGWTCDSTFWSRQISVLAKDHKVVALDLPGHGKAPMTEPLTMDVFAKSVVEVMRENGIERATLIGHSMGGPVIRQVYRNFPNMVNGLVFVDALMLDYPQDPEKREQMQKMLDGFRQNAALLEGRRKMVEGMLPETLPAALREEIRSKMLATSEATANSAMKGMMDIELFKADAIAVPTLIIGAARPPGQSLSEERLRAFIKPLDYVSWSGVSHFLQMEHPERFNATLVGWLNQYGL